MQSVKAYQILLRVKQVIAIAFIVGKILSVKLWIADRTFPVLPFFDALKVVPEEIHTLLFGVSMALLLLIILLPQKNKIVLFFLFVEACSIILDETRLQVWVYEYMLLLFPFIFLKKDDEISGKRILISIFLITGFTYFWSGFYKLNPGFILTVWKPITGLSFDSHFLNIGYLLPCLEIILATGIFFYRTQKVAATGLIIMHLFILVVFGPAGLNYNTIIWPWNLSMIVILSLLFLQKSNKVQFNIRNITQITFQQGIVLLLCLAPVLNMFGMWRDELSFKLYSGNTTHFYVCAKNEALLKAKKEIQIPFMNIPMCDGQVFSVKTWAISEMHIVPCSNDHYLQKLKFSLIEHGYNQSDLIFFMHKAPYTPATMVEFH